MSSILLLSRNLFWFYFLDQCIIFLVIILFLVTNHRDYNKSPQMWWLKTAETSFPVLEARSPKATLSTGLTPSEGSTGDQFFPLSRFCWLQAFLVLVLQPSYLYFRGHPAFPLFCVCLVKTPVIGFRSSWDNPEWSHLKVVIYITWHLHRPISHIRSHSEVLGIQVWTSLAHKRVKWSELFRNTKGWNVEMVPFHRVVVPGKIAKYSMSVSCFDDHYWVVLWYFQCVTSDSCDRILILPQSGR